MELVKRYYRSSKPSLGLHNTLISIAQICYQAKQWKVITNDLWDKKNTLYKPFIDPPKSYAMLMNVLRSSTLAFIVAGILIAQT